MIDTTFGKLTKRKSAVQKIENKISWDEQSVKDILEKIELGFKPKHTPFYEGDKTDWRRGDITYNYTQHEKDEIRKCKSDLIYFSNKYCQLMTDEGYKNITLRDYQEEMLSNFQSYKNNIVLSSRQIGKCVVYDTIVDVSFLGTQKTIKIGELYDWCSTNMKKVKINSPNNKLINSFITKNLFIKSNTGFEKVSHIHQTKPFIVWKLKTKKDLTLECADKHIVFDYNFNEVYVKDLKKGDLIQTENGVDIITEIQQTTFKFNMYDLTVDSKEHTYYSNGILSHNTTTAGIFLAWFLCFHKDKSCMLLANKGETVKEIVDKTQKILKYLPFFLKPGIINKTQRSIVLDNGSRLKSQATTKSSSIGDTVDLLYIDEFAYIDSSFAHEFWRQVLPTTSNKRSRVILTSTPNGRNLFYEIYNAASNKLNTFKPYRVDWWKVPGRDEKWKQETIANLANGNMERGEEDFNQQYGCQFLTSSSILLKAKYLSKWEKLKVPYRFRELTIYDDLVENVDYSKLKWHKEFDIDCCNQPNHFFIPSIDISEGLGGDYSIINIFEVILKENWKELKYGIDVFEIYDFFKLKQVGLYRDNNTELGDFTTILYHILMDLFIVDNIKVVLEWNNYGREIYYRLNSIYGDNNDFDESIIIHYQHSENNKYMKPGLKLNKANKPLLCFNLKEKVERGDIELNEHDSIEEASTFGKSKNGSYEGQMENDDIMMTTVNVSSVFNSIEFKSLVEDKLETLPLYIKQYIENIIDGYDNEFSDDNSLYDLFIEKQVRKKKQNNKLAMMDGLF